MTLTKYLDLLQLNGEVEMVPFGKSKLFTTTNKSSYSMLLDVYSEPAIIVGVGGRIEQANNKFFQDFGIPNNKNINGISIFDLNIKMFMDYSVKKNIYRMFNGLLYLKEIQYIEEDTNRIFLIKFKPIIAGHDSMATLINVIDVTDQHQKEDFIVLDKRLQTIFDISSSAVILVDKEGDVMNANKAAKDLLGIDGKYFLANVNVFNNIVNISCFKDVLSYLLKCGVKNELCIVCDVDRLRLINQISAAKSGSRYLRVVFIPIDGDNAGKACGEYAVMFKDITAESKVVRDIDQSKAMYRSFFANLYTGITIGKLVGDTNDLIYVDINKIGEKILRVKKEDIVGIRSVDAFPNLNNFYEYQKKYIDPYVNLCKNHDIESIQSYGYVPPLKYYSGPTEPWFSHYIKMLPSGYLISYISENFYNNMIQRSQSMFYPEPPIGDLLTQ